jgi:PAT family beta-lactamase induction signal transducer AmpG
MTMKQFSATQYALFSSLFALPRILAGPVTGVMVDAIGWRDFFLFTIAIGIPGMLMLQRFSPLGKREPEIQQLAEIEPRVLSRGELFRRAVIGGFAGFAVAALSVALLDAFKQQKAAAGFELLAPLAALFEPTDVSGWVSLFGVTLFSIVIALATAATAAARSKKP